MVEDQYSKLFSSITTSTVWMQPDSVRLIWITLLALKDKDGFVWGSIPGLAHVARVKRPATEKALEILSSPDPDSRTPDHDGRRIEAVEGGWRILNHDKYRNARDTQDRREYERTRKAEQRRQAKGSGPGQSGTSPTSPGMSANTDTDTDTDTDTQRQEEDSLRSSSSPLVLVSDLEDKEGSNKRLREPKSSGALAFDAYAEAYGHRYAVDPVVNAKVRGIFAQLVKRLGADDAIAVAGWYPTHNYVLYVRSGHAVDLLLRDAEKLRTEWATDRKITDTGARQADRRETTKQVFQTLMQEAASGT